MYLPEEEEDAQATKKMIEEAGRIANLLPSDVTISDNCKAIVQIHMKVFGNLSILFNNSAMQEMYDDLKDISLEVVEKTYRMNVLSMFTMTKYALPYMERGSAIIDSGSVAIYIRLVITPVAGLPLPRSRGVWLSNRHQREFG